MKMTSTLAAVITAYLGCAGWASADDGWLAGGTHGRQEGAARGGESRRARPLQNVLSLGGEWEFVTKGVAPSRHPFWGAFYAKRGRAREPSKFRAAGRRKASASPAPATPGTASGTTAPSRCATSTWATPGTARRVDVPTAWQGKRVWLKVGGVRSQGWFWVNAKPAAWVETNATAAPISTTSPISSSPAPRQPWSRRQQRHTQPQGPMVSSHRFGGLYRDVELEATPDTRIDDAWVRGDFDRQAAEIHATVAFATDGGHD